MYYGILAKRVKRVIYSVVPEEVILGERQLTASEHEKALKTYQAMCNYVQLFLNKPNVDEGLKDHVKLRMNRAVNIIERQ